MARIAEERFRELRARNFLAKERGFTLTELAVVLVIVALMIGGLLLPLAAQDNIRRTQETQKTLNDARDSLLGFAAANGRLPCPATALSNGIEDPVGGVCTLFNAGDTVPVGYLPSATLGLAPVDSKGRLLDGWNNPIRYGVTVANSSAFTKANGMATTGMTSLAPDLRVCASAPAAAALAVGQCAVPETANVLAVNAVAVIYSLGANASVAGSGTDETNNPNPNATIAADRVFVSHEPAPVGAANGEFDDIVVWLSPNILFNRMIAAGRLP